MRFFFLHINNLLQKWIVGSGGILVQRNSPDLLVSLCVDEATKYANLMGSFSTFFSTLSYIYNHVFGCVVSDSSQVSARKSADCVTHVVPMLYGKAM